MTDSNMPTIDSKTLRQKIKNNSIRIVDVRREQEYQQGHITNAINLPLAKLLADDSADSIQKIAQDLGISDETSVAIYDDTFGALSSRVVWALQYIGHKDVKLLDVTYSQWKDLGYEITTEVPEIESASHSVNINPEIMATAEYLEKVKENKNVDFKKQKQITYPQAANNSFTINVYFESANTLISPVIDEQRTGIISIENLINDGSLSNSDIVLSNTGCAIIFKSLHFSCR